MAKTAQEILSAIDKHDNTKDTSKTAYYREKKAKEFVTGYLAVKEMKEVHEANDDGTDFTFERAVEMLVEKWDISANEKTSVKI